MSASMCRFVCVCLHVCVCLCVTDSELLTEFRRWNVMEMLLTCNLVCCCVDGERETTSAVMVGTTTEINDGNNGTTAL